MVPRQLGLSVMGNENAPPQIPKSEKALSVAEARALPGLLGLARLLGKQLAQQQFSSDIQNEDAHSHD